MTENNQNTYTDFDISKEDLVYCIMQLLYQLSRAENRSLRTEKS